MMRIWTPVEGPRGRPRRAWWFDFAVAAAMVLPTALPVLGATVLPWPAQAVLIVALTAPLLLRRVWPVPVFAAMIVVAVTIGWVTREVLWSAGLVIALYTVASRCPRRETIGCALVLAIGVVGWSWQAYRDEAGWVSVSIVLTLVVVATTVFGLYIATRRALLAQLQQRTVQLELERDQQGALAAAAERARIAREMHDVVAHHLTVMVALAEGAASQVTRAPDSAGEAMRTVSATGRQALTDTRRLLGVLRETDTEEPERSPLPGLADLDSLVAGVRAAGLLVRFDTIGVVPSLDAGSQLVLYRLVQEALTNTMKHAGEGATAQVRVTCTDGGIELDVVDDGVGTRSGSEAGGRGLAGMHERITAVGGVVTAGPIEGGWAVRARLPAGADLSAISEPA